MTAIDHPVEIELKYRLLDLAAGERFLAAETLGPFRAVSAARAAQHEDRYLDTSDGALARAGYAARLRHTRTGTILTVKSTAPPDGAIARREELEGPADRTAEPSDWPPSGARSLILELCGDAPLVELVTVRQLRRKRRLKAVDATAELSLDEVDVVARGRVIHRFAELEAELTSGDEARLVELRPIFEADPSLVPATGSKLEAALAATTADDAGPRSRGRSRTPVAGARAASAALSDASARAVHSGPSTRDEGVPIADVDSPVEPARSTPSTPSEAPASASAEPSTVPATSGTSAKAIRKAARQQAATEVEGLVVGKTPGVLASDNVAEAGRKVLRFHLARMIAREPGTREGTDPEELH
ncbi:MAG TPA: CYTH domain-containing protein, partial [Candidatus Limnocylindrales bacterium]